MISSEIQFGPFTLAELGGESKGLVTVTQGLEAAQSVSVVAVQPAGNAGALTPSKFSVHWADALFPKAINNKNADTKEM